MFKTILLELLKLMPLALIFPLIFAASATIIKEKETRNDAIVKGTKKVIEKNLLLLSVRQKEVGGLSYLEAYELEILQLISEAELSDLFNIVITNLDNDVKITNVEREADNNYIQSQKIIDLYQSEDAKNKHKISKINIKSGRNKYGVTNIVGYAYLRYHPQKVRELEQEKAFIMITTTTISIFVFVIDYLLMSMFLKKYTLSQIIARGESACIEFKPCFFTDKKIADSRSLEYECAKVISSFLNTNGGYLFIGVSDDGEIEGLKSDFEYIQSNLLHRNKFDNNYKKCEVDEYKRKLISKLNKQIHPNSVSKLKISFKQLEDVEILVIKCPPSSTLVFNRIKASKKEYEICFRKETETAVYKNIKYDLENNQVVPLWKMIDINFSGYHFVSRIILWKIKTVLVQI